MLEEEEALSAQVLPAQQSQPRTDLPHRQHHQQRSNGRGYLSSPPPLVSCFDLLFRFNLWLLFCRCPSSRPRRRGTTRRSRSARSSTRSKAARDSRTSTTENAQTRHVNQHAATARAPILPHKCTASQVPTASRQSTPKQWAAFSFVATPITRLCPPLSVYSEQHRLSLCFLCRSGRFLPLLYVPPSVAPSVRPLSLRMPRAGIRQTWRGSTRPSERCATPSTRPSSTSKRASER